jgi:CBS domain containing-hemolysin-like protein
MLKSNKEGPSVKISFFSNLSSKLKSFPLFKNTRSKCCAAHCDNHIETAAEGKIINNLGSFSEKNLEDVMIPRSDIVAVDVSISLEELSKSIVEHAHTRTLVYQEHLDHILGFVHIKDLFEVIAEAKKFSLKKLIRKHIIAPHSMKLTDLLTEMQKTRTHIAVVVDEYGGTDGIVTIEDIIEEIVGNINDEHDIGEDEDYKIIKPGLIIASARMEIEDLEKILNITIAEEDDEFETIGGFIMAKSGSVLEKGEKFHITDDVLVEILEATPRAIKQVRITYK